MRADCQKDLLQHFFEVADTMPVDQRSRYFAWVTEKAFLPDLGMVEIKHPFLGEIFPTSIELDGTPADFAQNSVIFAKTSHRV